MGDIKLTEVKRILLESLQPLADKYGYKISKGKFALIKKEKEQISVLQFIENQWDDEVQIMPTVSVTVKEISDIWQKFDPNIESDIYNTYWCDLLKLEYWFEDKYWNDFDAYDISRLSIHNYEEIPSIASKIQNLFELYALPYINNFSNVEGVNKLMNSDPENEGSSEYHPKESAWWHCPGFHIQSTVGLIAAKLAGDAIWYKKISDIYTQKINKHKEEDTISENAINRFFEIKKYLG